MADQEFLRYFITEPVYVIPEANVTQLTEAPVQEEAIVEEEAVALDTNDEKIPSKDVQINFKGSTDSKVLVIVDQPGEPCISAATEVFLKKVLQAVQIQAADAGIVNLQANPHLTEDALQNFDAEKILAFGLNGKIFKNEYAPYEVTPLNGHKLLLNCSSLEKIAADAAEKKLLWTALQKMFLSA